MINQTEIIFSTDNKEFSKIIDGSKKLYDAVKTTMGPSGNTVIIERGYDKFPVITKDGVTVAKSINLKPKLEAVGASVIKEVATKTNETAGDGTTTATVFAFNLLNEGYKKTTMGFSPTEIKQGMEAALEDTKLLLEQFTTKITSYDESVSVATISANGDKDLGTLIANAVKEVGINGIVTVEQSKNFQTTLNLTNGMIVDSGYINPYFITNSEKANCVLDKPYVFIINQKLMSLTEILPVLDAVNSSNRSLLVICEDLEGDALNAFIANKVRGNLKVCAIKAPSFGEHRNNLLEDLAYALGTQVFGGHGGVALKTANLKNLGKLNKATITKTNSVLVSNSDEEEKERIKNKVTELETVLLSKEIEPTMIDRIKNRLSKLTGNVAIIRVGGSTEADVGERKDRIEDALNATLAANREGIVPGGGFALLRCSFILENNIKNLRSKNKTDSFIAGYQAFIKACEAPFKIIIDNTGLNPDIVYHEAKTKFESIEMKDEHFKKIGFNSKTQKWSNLFDDGVLDPILVTRSAITYACSVVSLVLSCKAIILDGFIEEKAN